jgi:hypothetical protein
MYMLCVSVIAMPFFRHLIDLSALINGILYDAAIQVYYYRDVYLSMQ